MKTFFSNFYSKISQSITGQKRTCLRSKKNDMDFLVVRKNDATMRQCVSFLDTSSNKDASFLTSNRPVA